MGYRIEWTENGAQQSREVETATLTDNWIGELKGKGAEKLSLFRDGTAIDPSELPELTRKEAAKQGDAADS